LALSRPINLVVVAAVEPFAFGARCLLLASSLSVRLGLE
jgi:hypothetical protein